MVKIIRTSLPETPGRCRQEAGRRGSFRQIPSTSFRRGAVSGAAHAGARIHRAGAKADRGSVQRRQPLAETMTRTGPLAPVRMRVKLASFSFVEVRNSILDVLLIVSRRTRYRIWRPRFRVRGDRPSLHLPRACAALHPDGSCRREAAHRSKRR